MSKPKMHSDGMPVNTSSLEEYLLLSSRYLSNIAGAIRGSKIGDGTPTGVSISFRGENDVLIVFRRLGDADGGPEVRFESVYTLEGLLRALQGGFQGQSWKPDRFRRGGGGEG